MASPNIDTNANCIRTYNSWSGGTSFSNSASVWKTSGANQLALAVISYEGMASAGQINSFTVSDGGTTLTFTLIPGARIQGNGGAVGRQTIEVWQCQCASQFNSGGATVTVSLTNSVAIDDGMITLLSLQSLADITAPLDPNALAIVAGVNTASAPPPTLTYSTTNADDLLLFVSAAIQTTSSATPSGWTANVDNTHFNGGGSLFESQMVCSKQVSSAQTSQTVQDASGNSYAHWSAVVLAFTGGGAPSSGYPRIIMY